MLLSIGGLIKERSLFMILRLKEGFVLYSVAFSHVKENIR